MVSIEETTNKVYVGLCFKQFLNQSVNGPAIETLEQIFFQKNIPVRQRIQNYGCLEQMNAKCSNEDC